jgi:glycosyltransferase involved in cell wall biosynthesis
MHVLHVTPYLAPAWAFGPVPQQVFALARAQRAHGLTVTVLTTDAMAPHERLRPGESATDDVRIIRVPSVTGALRSWLNLSTPIGFGRRAGVIVRAQRPDIVHLHEVYTVENLRTAAVLPRSAALVLSPHGAVRSSTPPWVRRAWHRWGGDTLLARTNMVVAADEEEKAELAALYARRNLPLDAARTAVVRDGIEVLDASRQATSAEARARFGLRDGPVVLFTGQLSQASGITLLVDAFSVWRRTAPAAQLLIVGADHGALAGLHARIRAAGMDTAVRVAGYLTGHDAQLAFAAADLFAAPGPSPGYATALIDALASGLPVLGMPSDVMQAAADAGVGDVPPPAVNAWESALQQTWAALSERPSLRDTARQVAGQFGWSAAAVAMASVYERALTVRP